jgi:adenosylcobinamide-GDP ribazoletransferase
VLSGAASAVAFLTVVGGARPAERTAVRWFPVVGAALGGALGGIWWAARELFPAGVAAVVVVAADLALTGMLHLDGLADAADGLLPPLDRERRLTVMRAPDVGAFALAVVPTVLLARWVALAEQPVAPWALVGLWTLSRTAMAVAPAVLPYARPDGLASPFVAGARRWTAAAALPAVGALLLVDPVRGPVAAAGAAAVAVAVLALAQRRLGGFTGDVLGAAAVLAETTGLVILAARP